MNVEDELREALQDTGEAPATHDRWARFEHRARSARRARALGVAALAVLLAASAVLVPRLLRSTGAKPQQRGFIAPGGVTIGGDSIAGYWTDAVAGFQMALPQEWKSFGGQGKWATFAPRLIQDAHDSAVTAPVMVGVHIDSPRAFDAKAAALREQLRKAGESRGVSYSEDDGQQVAGHRTILFQIQNPPPPDGGIAYLPVTSDCDSCSEDFYYLIDWSDAITLSAEVVVFDTADHADIDAARAVVGSTRSYAYAGPDPIPDATTPLEILTQYQQARKAGSGAEQWLARSNPPSSICYGTAWQSYRLGSYRVTSVTAKDGGVEFETWESIDNGNTEGNNYIDIGPGVDLAGNHKPWLVTNGFSADDPLAPCFSSGGPKFITPTPQGSAPARARATPPRGGTPTAQPTHAKPSPLASSSPSSTGSALPIP